ncbi:hypothetical protein MCOR17_009311 [Pyricularia oryzae]|nr:hypothetical protein MCOR17_009311 [Pyricularia oryzae]
MPCSEAGYNDKLLPRNRFSQNNPKPAVHFGLIASGNAVIKSGKHRNKIVQKVQNVVAFEMESAGVWDIYPCVVIKGACDYCNSHKAGKWQPYTAAAAAACLRAFLEEWVPSSHNDFRDFTDISQMQTPPPLEACGAEPAHNGSSLDRDITQKLIERLYFDRIDDRLTNLRAAQSNICRWFYNTPKYLAWRDTSIPSLHSGFLWIKGNPGTGKSTLMKLLFKEARAKAKHDPSKITLSFFFLARGTIEEKSTQGLYRSFLYQLFEKAKDLESSLEWMTFSGAKGIADNGWNEEALKQTFDHAVSEFQDRSLTIFVNALDDRYYPDIRTEEENQIALEAEEGHDEDIKKYIKAAFKIGGKKQVKSLRLEVFNKSSGIFLWVVLVLELFVNGNDISVQAMSKRLRALPPGLDDLFEKIITRDGENLEQLRVCLKVILFAERAFKPQELYFAVQLGLGIDKSGYWDHEDVQLDQMKIFVRTSSKGLAEVTRNKACEVQFIHESIRGYLMGSYSEQWSGYSENLEGNCQLFLRDLCLVQLNAPISELIHIPEVYRLSRDTSGRQVASSQLRSELNLKFPLFEYSILKVLYHANRAQRSGMDQALFLRDFPLKRWVMITNALEKRTIRLYSDSVSLVYILAEGNLASLIQAIQAHVQPASYFNVQCERYGPAIFAALACRSQEAALEMLTDPRIWTKLPLGMSCEVLLTEHCKAVVKENNLGLQFVFSIRKHIFGHLGISGEVIAQAYILSGADAATRFRDPDISAYEDFMKLLPVQGSGLDAPPVGLWWPASCGYILLLQQMLKAGADVNEIYPGRETPLYSAAFGAHAAAVRLLLDAGADVDTTDDLGATVLSRVAKMTGRSIIIQQLLDAGAEIDSTDHQGSGRFLNVELLLESGANKHLRDIDGETAAMRAKIYGHDDIAKLLLLG